MTIWWCNHYKRPLKDPILQEYTLEELIYEFYTVKEKRVYENELADAESDRIEEEKIQAEEDWADMMEAEDEDEPEYDPLQDPKNIEWMEKEIENSKLLFDDETFGEDVSLNFDDPEDV